MSLVVYLWAARFVCLGLACILNVFSTLQPAHEIRACHHNVPLIPNILTLYTSVVGALRQIPFFNTCTPTLYIRQLRLQADSCYRLSGR